MRREKAGVTAHVKRLHQGMDEQIADFRSTLAKVNRPAQELPVDVVWERRQEEILRNYIKPGVISGSVKLREYSSSKT
jgi:hypothetical protein